MADSRNAVRHDQSIKLSHDMTIAATEAMARLLVGGILRRPAALARDERVAFAKRRRTLKTTSRVRPRWKPNRGSGQIAAPGENLNAIMAVFLLRPLAG